MKKKKFTYKKSGVSIPNANKFVKYISVVSKKTINHKTKLNSFKNIGSFGSAFDLSPLKIKKPVIISSTDGVGTKIEIAKKLKSFYGLGIDLVAMCVNDLIVQGAKPLFFLDYISTSKINLPELKELVNGIIKGCKISKCELSGGETAEMPGIFNKNKFDIAGFAVGIVEKKKLLTKSKIKKNNIILAIPSSGLHSNGFSLVRHVLKEKKINIKNSNFRELNLKEELIKPTKIYVKEILNLTQKNLVNGCANITGGGLLDNMVRIIPKGLQANIDLEKIRVLKIFKWLKSKNIGEKEMLTTFNCGVGFCLIVHKNNIKKVEKIFTTEYKPYQIGSIINGSKKIKKNGKINWT